MWLHTNGHPNVFNERENICYLQSPTHETFARVSSIFSVMFISPFSLGLCGKATKFRHDTHAKYVQWHLKLKHLFLGIGIQGSCNPRGFLTKSNTFASPVKGCCNHKWAFQNISHLQTAQSVTLKFWSKVSIIAVFCLKITRATSVLWLVTNALKTSFRL